MSLKKDHYKNLSLEDIHEEIWQDVPLYDGVYQASSCGRIKSVERVDNRGRLIKEKIMRQHIAKSTGTLHVSVGEPLQKKRCRTVTSLIGLAFLGLRENYEVFTRVNKKKLDNRICNIIKTTRSESEILDYKYGKPKSVGFAGISHKGVAHEKRNKKGVYTSSYLYHSSLGSYTYLQLVGKYGKNSAGAICNSIKREHRSMGVKWSKIRVQQENEHTKLYPK